MLSPPWYQVEAPQPYGNDPNQQIPLPPSEAKKPGVNTYEVDFDKVEAPMSPTNFDKQSFLSGTTGNTKASAADSVADANAQMGLKWQACASSPSDVHNSFID